VLVPGSGMTKPSKRTFKAPAHLTQHRAAARRSAPPHDDPRQRGGRHATGPASAHRRGGMFRAPIYTSAIGARLVSFVYFEEYFESFVVVVSGQWCTHCDARDNRRLVAIKTAFARWRNPGELRGSLQHADEITKLCPISKKKGGWRSGLLRAWWLSSPVIGTVENGRDRTETTEAIRVIHPRSAPATDVARPQPRPRP